MKRHLLLFGALTMVLLFGTGGSIVTGAGFDDPNVKAMHDMVNGLNAKAERGDPKSQNDLGMINLFGFGGNQDLATARGWFQKAADQGYPESMVQLGNIYENGLGIKADPAKALELYKKATDLKHPQGMFRLGLLYLNGTGVTANEGEADKLFRQGCAGGYQTSCGLVLLRENKNAEARVAFTKQCRDGDQMACVILEQLGPEDAGAQAGTVVQPERKGGIGIYLVIGLLLVGILIFWLIRTDPDKEEGPEKKDEVSAKKE